MSKKINFKYLSDYAWEVIDRAAPAKNFIPKWHRDMKPYHDEKIKIVNGESNATPKKCVPMLDAMTAGYIVPLWTDVIIEENEEDVSINWRVIADVFQGHGQSSTMVPAPKECYPTAFKYVSHLTVETPPGYSILVIPPAGHYDSPFFPLTAIIDSDKPNIDFAFPLWIKRGSAGIIEKGTPVVQIIPFKREDWASTFDHITEQQYFQRRDKVFSSTIKNNYFKNIWSRKEYK